MWVRAQRPRSDQEGPIEKGLDLHHGSHQDFRERRRGPKAAVGVSGCRWQKETEELSDKEGERSGVGGGELGRGSERPLKVILPGGQILQSSEGLCGLRKAVAVGKAACGRTMCWVCRVVEERRPDGSGVKGQWDGRPSKQTFLSRRKETLITLRATHGSLSQRFQAALTLSAVAPSLPVAVFQHRGSLLFSGSGYDCVSIDSTCLRIH